MRVVGPRRRSTWATAAGVMLLLARASPAWAALAGSLLAGSLDQPVAIANAGDGSGRLFVVEQPGRIRVWTGTTLLSTPFLDLTAPVDLVACCGERGLLSLAFHPDHAVNGRFYVFYTREDDVNTVGVNELGDIVLVEYLVSAGDPNLADATSAGLLLTVEHSSQSNHNGGSLAFGPDGYLYVSLGDGGGGNDFLGAGQDLDTLLAKVLRLDVDGGPPYASPVDNPFVGAPGRDEIWAFGLRNPWRMTFDRLVPELWIGDVGQNLWEEVNRQPDGTAATVGGRNYGWSCREGAHPGPNDDSPPCLAAIAPFVDPVLEYAHTQAPPDPQWRCSITGGYRYRGTMVAELGSAYVHGDYCSGEIWGAEPTDDGSWSTNLLIDLPRGGAFADYASLTSFGEDEAGELYFTLLETAATCTPPCGGLYRLTGAHSGRLFEDGFEWRSTKRWSAVTP